VLLRQAHAGEFTKLIVPPCTCMHCDQVTVCWAEVTV